MKFNKLQITGIILFCVFLIANVFFFFVKDCCAANVSLQEIKLETINQDNWLELSKNSESVIIDVRTSQEFLEKNIDNSINIDFYSDDFKEKLNSLDKSKTYLIYCRSGNRSGKTLKIMKELGFMIVYDLKGGINGLN